MKSATEAWGDLRAAYGCPDVGMVEAVAAIQLDAFKAGMTKAALIASSEFEINNDTSYATAKCCARKILRARDGENLP